MPFKCNNFFLKKNTLIIIILIVNIIESYLGTLQFHLHVHYSIQKSKHLSNEYPKLLAFLIHLENKEKMSWFSCKNRIFKKITVLLIKFYIHKIRNIFLIDCRAIQNVRTCVSTRHSRHNKSF